ncbi:MAG: hypothetical protein SV186_01330 [Candidatus Nanohaloarchaea archaeon]|nr:hypothetical protein [Candidatus Nanohaloarchaea archaeon]
MFVFIMAIVYGLLQKIELFDDETVDAAIALVTAFMSVAGIIQVFGGTAVFSWFFSLVTLGLFVLLGYVLILGILGVDITEMLEGGENRQRNMALVAAGILALIIIYMLSYTGVEVAKWLTGEAAMTVVMVVGIVYIMKYMTSGD